MYLAESLVAIATTDVNGFTLLATQECSHSQSRSFDEWCAVKFFIALIGLGGFGIGDVAFPASVIRIVDTVCVAYWLCGHYTCMSLSHPLITRTGTCLAVSL